MSARSFRWSTRLRFIDTDASRRLHYTAMFRYFESAETEFLREIGFPYSTREDAKITFPRVHVEADFTGAVEFDDLIDIDVRVAGIGNTSLRFEFAATVNGNPVATGKETIVCVNRETFAKQPLPEQLISGLKAFGAI